MIVTDKVTSNNGLNMEKNLILAKKVVPRSTVFGDCDDQVVLVQILPIANTLVSQIAYLLSIHMAKVCPIFSHTQ